MIRPLLLALAALGPAACTGADPGGLRATFAGAERPEGAPSGTCWGKTATPAVIETVTEHVLDAPASYNTDGTLYRSAQYRTVRRQEIVEERREDWFETPCPDSMTPEFVSSLQRALTARGAYGGPVTGAMDRGTRAAVRAWQAARGLDSERLSLATARELGLIAVAREG